MCGDIKKIISKNMCSKCYHKYRKENDIEYNIRNRLRKKVSKNVISGKLNKSLVDKYIDYGAIYNYIGPPPDKNCHIDHIFPLIAFNLCDPIHVKAAFAPENHQWLSDRENMSKKDKYNKEEFEKYLKKITS
jgi:hypothetical protein